MSSGSSGQPSTSPAAGGKSVPANLVEGSGSSQNAEGIISPKLARVPVSEGIIFPKLSRVPVSEGIVFIKFTRVPVSESIIFPKLSRVPVPEGIIFPKLPRVQGIPIFKILYLEKR